MNQSYYLEQGTYSRFTSANRLAAQLMALNKVNPDEFGIAVRIYPFEVLTNQEATTKWIINTLEATEVAEDELVEHLFNKFNETFYRFLPGNDFPIDDYDGE